MSDPTMPADENTEAASEQQSHVPTAEEIEKLRPILRLAAEIAVARRLDEQTGEDEQRDEAA